MIEKTHIADRFYDRFDLVFIVTVATVTLLLLIDLDQGHGVSEFLAVTVTILTAAMLVLSVMAAGVGRRGLRFTWITVALTVSGSIVAAFAPGGVEGHGGLLWLTLVVAAPVLVLRRLVRHRVVTIETVLGAVSVYLMMAVSATYLFLFIDAMGQSGGRFFGHGEPTTVFMYFSLVTITTLGYGDFAPVGVFGRAAAAWIAIIGQIYLVVVVARMVTMFSGTVPSTSDPDPDDGD